MDGLPKTNSHSYESFLATRYFRSLDALRCFAILGVLWHHSGPHAGLPALFTRGYLGVDLFFVLSGFLITTLLLREHTHDGSISIPNFYIRRVLRIFPLYYAYLLFLCISYIFLHAHSAASDNFLNAVPYYATYTSNWLPAEMREPIFARSWSLSVEEQFYLFWPTFLVAFGSRRVVPILLTFIAGLFVGSAIDWGQSTEYLAVAPFSPIAIGALLGLALNRPVTYRVASKFLGQKYSVLLVIGMLILLLLLPGKVDHFLRLAVHLTMAALVCSVVVRNDHALSKFADAKLIIHVGIVSYGIYVLHGQFGGITDRVAAAIARLAKVPELASNEFLHFAILTVISTIAATISYYCFEKFFLNLKQKYSDRTQLAESS
jgi:peptidoglycan/LPS O-acetylase OafA/YrhL